MSMRMIMRYENWYEYQDENRYDYDTSSMRRYFKAQHLFLDKIKSLLNIQKRTIYRISKLR